MDVKVYVYTLMDIDHPEVEIRTKMIISIAGNAIVCIYFLTPYFANAVIEE